MADNEISNLVELATADAADVLPIVDTSATSTKKITFANLVTAPLAAHEAAADPHAGYAKEGVATSSGLTVSATDRLLGRSTAGAGAIEEVTLTAAGRSILDDATAADILTTLSGVSLTPVASQTIVAQGAAIVPLIVKSHATPAATIFEVQDSTGAAVVAYEPAAGLRLKTPVGAVINERYADNAFAAQYFMRKSRHATLGSHTIVASGDAVGQLMFAGSDGAAYRNLARISGEVDGTPASSDMPGRLVFSTATDGGITLTERLRIDNAGDFTIAEGGDVILGTTTGTKFGTSVSQKIGFFNVTPVIQPAAAAQAAAPAGGTGTAAGGWDTAVNRDAAIATINAMRTALVNLGIIKGSA